MKYILGFLVIIWLVKKFTGKPSKGIFRTILFLSIIYLLFKGLIILLFLILGIWFIGELMSNL